MNFICFNAVLLGAAFAAILLFSIGIVAIVVPFYPVRNNERLARGVALPMLVVAVGYQMYFWSLWSALCVAVSKTFMSKPDVTWDWCYWVCGFMWSQAVIGWFEAKEIRNADPDQARGIQGGAALYSLVAAVAFIVVAIWPSTAQWLFGWFFERVSRPQ